MQIFLQERLNLVGQLVVDGLGRIVDASVGAHPVYVRHEDVEREVVGAAAEALSDQAQVQGILQLRGWKRGIKRVINPVQESNIP